MPLIPIVDEDDNIIEYVEFRERKPEQRYRVAALWVTNSDGDILIAQRHRSKKHHPLLWWPAAAGTVEKGETYEQNIIKETEEEIGVANIEPILGPKTQTKSGYPHFTQWFRATIDRSIHEFILQSHEFILQSDEVEQIRWISREVLKNEIASHPEKFLPTFPSTIKLFL